MANPDSDDDCIGAHDEASSPSGRSDAALAAQLQAGVELLRTEARRHRVSLDDSVDHAIITLDDHGRVTGWNAGAQRITGYSEAEALGRSGDVIFTTEDRANGRFPFELRSAGETGWAVNERWHLRRDGSRFWASGTMTPLPGEDGRPAGFLNIFQDRTAMQAMGARRELLMAEMNHRMRNIFAVVQAVADHTGRSTLSVAEFQTAFGNRLRVMAGANDLLLRTEWRDAPLREVIAGALEVCGDPDRISLDGPAVMLPGNSAMNVSLAFHELATNAVKYGALSNGSGEVDVSWTTTGVGADRVDIVWRERGGPAVEPPARRGFGSMLLDRGMSSGTTVTRRFERLGVECRLSLPLVEPSRGHPGESKAKSPAPEPH